MSGQSSHALLAVYPDRSDADAAVDQVAERLMGCEALHRLRVDRQTLAALADEDGAVADG